MRALRRTEPDEATTVAMENDLLRLEVAHLRARLAAAEIEVRRAEARAEEWRAAAVTPLADPLATAALADLTWLLRRLEGTPFASVLRRREGYRRLVATYLREDAG